ncbi:hypothetical protein Cylst_0046 [Cylindrospermum stagnale PCC 7417]|uniref:Addiction module component n=1 Tax=Cylindrospermum stagnale PCC 7417 TaxID=56107 RepID=K9WQG4_9NOST|nr:hypothetical protein [Cylindrospermum stagnale]AFZ22428.1 hypothetical protein Cylst_0046 [Cylindrospermum stagnale PCC 7417]
MLEKTSTLQQAIEVVEALDPEDQVILIDIIQNRLKQQRRDALLKAVAEAREAYSKGEVRSGTVADLVAELDS